MFGEISLELIKELQRSKDSTLPPWNDDVIGRVVEEMEALFLENQKEVESAERGNSLASVHLRHYALLRNRRNLVAYAWNRLERVKSLRWDFGSILPPDVKENLSEAEVQWSSKYNRTLATYMRKIGGGLDLTQDKKPPKSLYVLVRCLQDYGEIELDDGTVVPFRVNSQHYLPRSKCEQLIRLGVLEHIISK